MVIFGGVNKASTSAHKEKKVVMRVVMLVRVVMRGVVVLVLV